MKNLKFSLGCGPEMLHGCVVKLLWNQRTGDYTPSVVDEGGRGGCVASAPGLATNAALPAYKRAADLAEMLGLPFID